MKHKRLVITFLSVAAFAIGCKKEETVSQQLDNVKTETKAAARELKDYTFAQKAEFTEQMQNQLLEINRELDQISGKIEKSSEPTKAEAKLKLQTLRDQLAKLNKKLEETKSATESTWGDVKAGFQKGYSELKDGFQQARQWVSEKIAP